MGFFDRRLLKKYAKEADKVIALEKQIAALTDEELQQFISKNYLLMGKH